MFPLRLATASQEIPLGPFLDANDANTQMTGLTINAADIKLWKSGATAKVSKNSGGGTHMTEGDYSAVLDATDTDTLGPMKVTCHKATALAVQLWCIVMTAVDYDAYVAGLTYPRVNPYACEFSTSGSTVTSYARDGSTTDAAKTSTNDGAALPITGLT